MTSRRFTPPDRATTRRLLFGAAGIGACAVLATVSIDSPIGETLAGYKDAEFAQFGMSSGSWNMQGSTDHTDTVAGTWADHFSSPATMTLSSATVSPTTKVYAPFSVRLAQGSTQAGTVTLNTGTVTSDPAGVAGKFTVRLVSTNGACSAGQFTSSAVYLLGSPSSYASPTTAPAYNTGTLPAATTSAPGSPVSVCFEFGVLNDQSANGKSVTVQWTITAAAN